MVEMVEGARYRRRDGIEVPDPATRSGSVKFPWRVGEHTYTSVGGYWNDDTLSEFDLVEMTHDPRKQSEAGRISALEARVAELEKEKRLWIEECNAANAWLLESMADSNRHWIALNEVRPREAGKFTDWLRTAFNAGRKFEKENAK